jgi:hypothetical protein
MAEAMVVAGEAVVEAGEAVATVTEVEAKWPVVVPELVASEAEEVEVAALPTKLPLYYSYNPDQEKLKSNPPTTRVFIQNRKKC